MAASASFPENRRVGVTRYPETSGSAPKPGNHLHNRITAFEGVRFGFPESERLLTAIDAMP